MRRRGCPSDRWVCSCRQPIEKISFANSAFSLRPLPSVCQRGDGFLEGARATVTLGARYLLQKAGGERWLDAQAFFVDVMTTALEPDELLVAVEIPKQAAGTGVAHKSLRRVEGAFPIVLASAAIAPGFREAKVGLGGVGPRPVVIDATDVMKGGLDDAALRAVGDRAFEGARHALADLNGSGEYRREMARVHARRAVHEATAMMLAGGRP